MAKKGRPWSPAQRKKFLATQQSMLASGKWGKGRRKKKKGVQKFPLHAIPGRKAKTKYRTAPRKAIEAAQEDQRFTLALGIVGILGRLLQ